MNEYVKPSIVVIQIEEIDMLKHSDIIDGSDVDETPDTGDRPWD